MGIVHRDIKPSNVLVDPLTSHTKICDFGCALLVEHSVTTAVVSTPAAPAATVAPAAPAAPLPIGSGNLNDPIGRPRVDAPVICALTYRAPELLFASPYYSSSNAVDLWSAGCIFAELLTERPIFFPAVQECDLFFRFMLLLGTPTEEDIRDMQLGNSAKTMLAIAAHHYLPPSRLADTLFRGDDGSPGRERQEKSRNAAAVQLLEKLLVYSPRKRITAGEALADPWFSEKEDNQSESADLNTTP